MTVGSLTIVTATFAPEVNGVTRALDQLIPAIESLGVPVRVVAPDYSEVTELLPEKSPNGWHGIVTRYPSKRFGGYPVARAPRPGALRVAQNGHDDRIVVFEPDRLQYGNIRCPIVSPKHAVAFLRQDYLAAARAYYSKTYFALAQLPLRTFIRYCYSQYAELAVPSQAAAGALGGVKIRRPVNVLPNGVDHDLFAAEPVPSSAAPLRLAYAGRLAPEKNVLWMAEAFAPGAFTAAEVTLDVFGDGPQAEAFALACDPEVVRLHGFVEPTNLRDALKSMHALLSPCPVETFGNSVLEGMAMGRAVIGVAGGANDEHIREARNGYRVENSGLALYRRIRQLIDQPPPWSALGREASEYAAQFRWHDTAERLLELVEPFDGSY